MLKSFRPLFFSILLAPLLFSQEAKAQDPQFSQYYAAPLYLNPAFAGSAMQGRIGLNYRNQWPSLDASFTTFSAYGDYYFDDYNSGVGVIITGDREGLAGLRSNTIGLQYAYQLNITEKLTFRPGAEVAFTMRDINFNRLTFGDQYDESGFISPTSAEAFATGENVFYPDLGLGGLFFSPDYWIGFSMHHILEPNQSFTDDNAALPRKYSVHGGYKIRLASHYPKGYNTMPRERSITPTFNYKSQGAFDQLDVGMYFTAEPVVVGAWYRGIPFKDFEGFPSREAAVVLVGFTMNGMNIGYSFDYTLSELGIGSGGAHEISIGYLFPDNGRRKPPKNVRLLPCPTF